jgi:putative phage-type endonuclease
MVDLTDNVARAFELGLDYPTIVADIEGWTEEQWLARRLLGLGGSDAAASGGFSPWKSKYGLWVEKRTHISSFEDNERMKWGRRLEGAIADGYAEDHEVEIVKLPLVLAHPQHPWMLADVDRFVLGDDGMIGGVLEVKNTDKFMGDTWEGDAPLHYKLQGLHYLAVTGLPWVDLYALVGGNTPRPFHIERNEDDIENLIDIEARFWKLVVDQTPPAYDGEDSTLAVVKSVWAGVDPDSVLEMSDTIREVIARHKDAKALADEAKKLKQAAEVQLIEWLGDYETAIVDGEVVYTRKMRKAYTVKEHDVSASRVLTVK